MQRESEFLSVRLLFGHERVDVSSSGFDRFCAVRAMRASSLLMREKRDIWATAQRHPRPWVTGRGGRGSAPSWPSPPRPCWGLRRAPAPPRPTPAHGGPPPRGAPPP